MNLEKLKLALTGADRCDPAHSTSWNMPGVYDSAVRERGLDWPSTAVTMIGVRRLSHLQECIESILREDIPGDFIETGVWRGGACILMRAVLAAYGNTDRTVWVADSFEGMPVAQDSRDEAWDYPELAVPLARVEENFRQYGLLDEHVRFLPGWFKDTLPGPVEKLAILRLDGDYYSSTMDVLTALYPKVSSGGHVIVDDWCMEHCREAVIEYAFTHDLADPGFQLVDGIACCWRKS